MYERVCPVCNQTFFTSDHRRVRCSRKCFVEFARHEFRKRVELTCKQCGKVYQQKPCKAKTSSFCSRKCQRANRTKVGMLRLTCKVCGKEFTRRASRTGDFCSYACSGFDQRLAKVAKVCEVCGKAFEVENRFGSTARFCSRPCKQHAFINDVRPYIGKRGPTTIEVAVQQALEQLQIEHEPQAVVGRFLVDFLLPQHRVVIEADGDYWHNLPEAIKRDARKNKYLAKCGYRVIRLWEHEIKNAESAADLIASRFIPISP